MIPGPAETNIDRCEACGQAIAPEARFCGACGAAVAAAAGAPCPACQTINPDRAQFCLNCGAPLSSPAQADRRIVTVLFADLSGFTEMSEEADPEEVRELIAACLDRLCQCIIRWDGYVDKFIGDCVMALFGAPVAYENEAERAVRAALAMQDALKDWSAPENLISEREAGYKPQLRIGICTGPVVTGLFAGGGALNYTAVGDTVNVAARLERQCEAGRVLVDATTYDQTKHIFDYEDEQVLQVKGRREAVRARHVIGVRVSRGKARGFEDQRIPLISRDRELSLLHERWRRTLQGGFELCLITGPAGIGKSRLVEELVRSEGLREDQVAEGRSYPYSSSTPWEPIAELIRDVHSLPIDLAPRHAAARVVAGSADGWPPQLEAGLTVALGSPISEVRELQGFSPSERQEWIRKAVIRSLRADQATPKLLVLEDLHWADLTTLEALCRLTDAPPSGPALLLLVARPPLPDEKTLAKLFQSVADRIDLQPLTADQSLRLMEALLGRHELPGQFLSAVTQRAEGNPLFVEEILKSLLDSSAIAQIDGVWKAAGSLESLEVPDTIESVLSTRIDRLDTSTKSVLQYAAIVGRRFWSGVVADALAGRPVDRELDRLLEGAFVRSLPSSMVTGDNEYLFEHLLLQEVAYEGILRRFRAKLHGTVAGWLEARLGPQVSEYAEWIAFHYERSDQPDRALPFLERAAATARERGSLGDARSLVERALDKTTTPESRSRLLILTEDIAAEAGDVETRRTALAELERLAVDQADERLLAEAEYRRALYQLQTGDLSAARANGQKALQRFERLADISMQADVFRLLARISHLWGDPREALKYYRISLPLERQAGDRYGQAEVFDQLGLVQIDLDDFTTALDYFEAAREICTELGQRPAESRVIGHYAMALLWLGRYEEAESAAKSALDLAERCGSLLAQAGVKIALAAALNARGQSREAEELARDVCDIARQTAQPGLEARGLLLLAQAQTGPAAADDARRARALARQASLAHVDILALVREAELSLAAGDKESAEQASAEAFHKLSMRGKIEGPEEAVLHTRALVLEALGRHAEAVDLYEQARATVRGKAEKIEDPQWRQRFLRDIPLNRAIMEAGDDQTEPPA
ncbi:MAG: adenylate/guanylate cyclase domain-containing protein [Gemmatimonadales bacterium]|jgi:predicted ATPase/class 3 adenylate cyclase